MTTPTSPEQPVVVPPPAVDAPAGQQRRPVTSAQLDSALANLADIIHLGSRHQKSGTCTGENEGCQGGPDRIDLERADDAWAYLLEDLNLYELDDERD